VSFPEVARSASQPELNAPTPWRAVRSFSEISAAVDASGHTLFVSRAEVVAYVVEIVNRQVAP